MPSYNADMVTAAIADGIGSKPRGAQTRLAELLGVSVSTVNKWVQGQTVPEIERWPAIEAFFDWPPGYLVERLLLTAPVARDRLSAIELALGALLGLPAGWSDHLLAVLSDDELIEWVRERTGVVSILSLGEQNLVFDGSVRAVTGADLRLVDAVEPEERMAAAVGDDRRPRGRTRSRPSPRPR